MTGSSRLRVALALGVLAGASIGLARAGGYPAHSDWIQVYQAARALIQGVDPYATVTDDGYPLYYPLPAAVLALPLTVVSAGMAHILWAGLSTAAVSYALLGKGWWGVLALGSAPFLNALLLSQWAPLLVGATAIPWLGMAWLAKPNVGLAFLAAFPSRQALLGIGVLGLLSLLLFPAWPTRWLASIDTAPHIRPLVVRPGGVLLLLAVLRWRHPEARLLAALGCVPQNMMPYEMLGVFLVPQTLRHMGILVLLSQVAFALAFTLAPDTTHGQLADTHQEQWPIWLLLVYMPALVMVLRRPPKPTVEVR